MNIEREIEHFTNTGQTHAFEWRDTGVVGVRKTWLGRDVATKQQERLRYSVRRGKGFRQTRMVAVKG